MPVAVCIATCFINNDLFESLAELALCSTPVGRKKTNVRWLLRNVISSVSAKSPRISRACFPIPTKPGKVCSFWPLPLVRSHWLSLVMLSREGVQRFPPMLLGTPLCICFFPKPDDSRPCPYSCNIFFFPTQNQAQLFLEESNYKDFFLSYSFQQLCIFTVILPKKKRSLIEVKWLVQGQQLNGKAGISTCLIWC